MKLRYKHYIINTDKIYYAKLGSTYDPFEDMIFYKVNITFEDKKKELVIYCDSKEDAEELMNKLL